MQISEKRVIAAGQKYTYPEEKQRSSKLLSISWAVLNKYSKSCECCHGYKWEPGLKLHKGKKINL